ncbi:MAG TPA: phosphatase PAP2 family protein [Longimicrobiales bacterium]
MTAWIVRMGLRDEALLLALIRRRRGWLDRVLRRVTHLGDALTTVPAAAVLLAASPRGVGGRVAWALLASHLAVQAVKRTVSRPRPHLPAGIDSLVHAPDRFSFPSGHAAATLSIALPVAWALPAPLGTGVVGLALLVGASRAYLGVHYPGDVVAGWILAAAGAISAAPVVGLLSGLA